MPIQWGFKAGIEMSQKYTFSRDMIFGNMISLQTKFQILQRAAPMIRFVFAQFIGRMTVYILSMKIFISEGLMKKRKELTFMIAQMMVVNGISWRPVILMRACLGLFDQKTKNGMFFAQ